MPWVRVSDDFMDHDRFEDIPLAAIGLWLTGLAWSNRNLKNGMIPKNVARSLRHDSRPKTIKILIESGLWIEHRTHYEIRNYLDYQDSKEKILTERAKSKAKMAQWRSRSKESADHDGYEPPPEE